MIRKLRRREKVTFESKKKMKKVRKIIDRLSVVGLDLEKDRCVD